MITDIVPGLDIISTFFTVAYILWLSGSILFGGGEQGESFGARGKRSLMNQHIRNRALAA